jgi:hypothetical protein
MRKSLRRSCLKCCSIRYSWSPCLPHAVVQIAGHGGASEGAVVSCSSPCGLVAAHSTVDQKGLIDAAADDASRIRQNQAVDQRGVRGEAPCPAATLETGCVPRKEGCSPLQRKPNQRGAVGQPRAPHCRRAVGRASPLNGRHTGPTYTLHGERLIQSNAIRQSSGHHLAAGGINAVDHQDRVARNGGIVSVSSTDLAAQT